MLANRTMTALASVILGLACAVSRASEPPTRLRQPVSLVSSPDGLWLYAANSRSGSVSVVDPKLGRVVDELDVARGLSDLAILPDGRRLLAVDRAGDALVVLKVEGDKLAVESRVSVAPDPATVVVKLDGLGCVVASTGSRKLSVLGREKVEGDGPISLQVLRSVDLPFGPRLMAWAGSKLVVAGSFGGRIAVVDPGTGRVESSRSIPGHNIRGLAASPDGRSMAVAHQVLSRLARSSFEDIHWGALINNHLRVLRVEALLNPDADLLEGSRLVDLGETGRGAGDPGAVAFRGDGRLVAVALNGVGEVAIGPDPFGPLTRVVVGGMPSSVLPGPDGSVVYVLDAMDDAIAVVEVATGTKIRSIGLGPRPELSPVDRGERLFFDARLSHDGWMSCQSCHTDGQSNGLLADTLGDGGFGAPKRVSSLLGVGSTGPWTWLGTVDRLEDQVRKSVETSMRGRAPTSRQVDDLAAYLRSLGPPRPMASRGDEESVARGLQVFRSRKCGACHAGPEFTEASSFDVGLVDEAGNRAFNPPSLRGSGDRASYLHDGRASTLAEVFNRHRHPRESDWSSTEVEDLVAYLRTL